MLHLEKHINLLDRSATGPRQQYNGPEAGQKAPEGEEDVRSELQVTHHEGRRNINDDAAQPPG